MITIKVDEDYLLELLMDRVEQWTSDETVLELYRQMYDSYVYGGVFEDGEVDIMGIVDNDYINYCDVISEGDDGYDEIKAIYDEQGLGDCSVESETGYGFIEAEYNDTFLVRG